MNANIESCDYKLFLDLIISNFLFAIKVSFMEMRQIKNDKNSEMSRKSLKYA